MSKNKPKTSKNNPNARKKNIILKKYNGKEVIPIMSLGLNGKKTMILQYKDTPNDVLRENDGSYVKFYNAKYS